MKQHFISPEMTVAELRQKAEACEKQAEREAEPAASELRDKAKLYREWIAQIRSGRWTA
jgi:hypothetical protein